MLFIEYPKCTTCKKAKSYLDKNNLKYIDRHIKDDNPSKEELTKWITASGKPVKKFFNTSGLKYKELGLKDKLPAMSEEEQTEHRPAGKKRRKRRPPNEEKVVLAGFKEDKWAEIL